MSGDNAMLCRVCYFPTGTELYSLVMCVVCVTTYTCSGMGQSASLFTGGLASARGLISLAEQARVRGLCQVTQLRQVNRQRYRFDTARGV